MRVRACGIVPNLANLLANWSTWFPELPLPPLPAIFGLDPVGEITAVGTHVHAWRPGDRVYVKHVWMKRSALPLAAAAVQCLFCFWISTGFLIQSIAMTRGISAAYESALRQVPEIKLVTTSTWRL